MKKILAFTTVLVIAICMSTIPALALAGYSGYCYDVDARNNQTIQSYHGGWIEDGNGAKFVCDDNSFITGWWKIGQSAQSSTWRFFDENGYLVKGWAGFDAADKRVWDNSQVVRQRFFDLNDGHLYEGYQTISWGGVNYNYYFAPSGNGNYRNGILVKNAQAPNGAWADANGVLQWNNPNFVGQVVIDPSQQGCPIGQNGTAMNNQSYLGTWTMPYQTTAQTVYPGQTPEVVTNGNTGWIKTGSYYRHYTNGKLDKGLTVIGGYSYYFDSSGNMATGWRTVGSSHRYFDKQTGIMYFGGWAEIDGYSYYFDSSGVNLRDTITPDGYYVGTNGRWDGKTRLSAYGPGF